MAENMSIVDKLKDGIAVLSAPETKEAFSSLSFESVKEVALDVLKNRYFCFDGTAGCKEFWQFYLAAVIICLIPVIGPLAMCLPMLGVTARRLRDTGESPWWTVATFILPPIGTIIVLILALRKSAQPCGCGCGCEQK